jgi:multicomponent Na+:H+ antiporter subunit D
VSALQAHMPALQVIVPMLSAPLMLLLKEQRLCWAATTLTSLCSFAIAVALCMDVLAGHESYYLMGSWPDPYGIELGVDAFSVLLLLVVNGASTLVLMGAFSSLNQDIEGHRQPLFYSAWLLAVAGLNGILVTADAFNIFVFMEISALASYVLVSAGPNRRALPAVFKYLIMGTIGATFYLIGVGLIYLMTGTLNLADMEIRIHQVADQKPILVAAGFITIGLALKAAVFPLHVWLPNAYTYAPNMVTVFLAACATKVSLYILLRFDFFVFQPNLAGHDLQFAYFLMPLSLLAVLVASTVAMFEPNLKRMLAWSSVAQIGYITLGASLVSLAGITAGLLHMFNHALAKTALFLAVACLGMSVRHLRLENISGIARQMPWTMAAFVLAGLSLIGVPGTAGFISKWYLISAVFESGPWGIALAGVIVISSLMAVVYIWRVVEVAYFGSLETGSTTGATIAEAPLPLLLVTWAAVALNFYFGFAASLPVELSTRAARILLGHIP